MKFKIYYNKNLKMSEGKLAAQVAEYEKLEKYDIILYLCSDVDWVEDGLRINKDRDKTNKLIKEMLDERDYNNVHYITGSYEDRLNKAIYILNKEMWL